MFGISDGFDIVIGNPPYYKENDDKRRFEGFRGLECYQGKMDVCICSGRWNRLVEAQGHPLLHRDEQLDYQRRGRKVQKKAVAGVAAGPVHRLQQLHGVRIVLDPDDDHASGANSPNAYSFDYRRLKGQDESTRHDRRSAKERKSKHPVLRADHRSSRAAEFVTDLFRWGHRGPTP